MVKAVETSLREILEGSKQYQVPLYQRTYSWMKPQLQRLWDDVDELADSRRAGRTSATHFIGSLVLAPTADIGPAGVSRYLVVDGQQRLTTLTLLLAAIRDHRSKTESTDHRDRINEQYLINRWHNGDHRLKVLPTQADRAQYLACIDSSALAGSADGIGEAYRFFSAQLVSSDDPDDPFDIEAIEEAVLYGLTLVSVTTSHDDNVHRIFESLNNTGLRLTQGDLIRNYLFMRLPTRGESVYQTAWKPLQDRLTNDQLELLFWLDIVQRDDTITQRDTYQGQVSRMDALEGEPAIEAEVTRFNRLSQLLQLILEPSREEDPEVRVRLQRLADWGTTTVYPLLLHLLDRRSRGIATNDEIAGAMLVIESYLVRRVLIGRATANLNRILLRAVPEISDKQPADSALRKYLSTGRKFFATDEQVRASARTTAFYYSGRSPQRKLILSWLEDTYGSKEPVDPGQCTIEHILPQTLTPSWRTMLRSDLSPEENFNEVYESLLHTIGNLTLTGHNSSLGNKPFHTKAAAFRNSGFQMNMEVAESQEWNRGAILRRGERLADRAIDYWPGPDPDAVSEDAPEQWGLLNKVLAEIPAGCWTTYGALAQVIGSHPVPVGQRLAEGSAPNGWRVLQIDGHTSPGFRWSDPDRTDSQREALEAAGVRFDTEGRADPSQQLSADDLATLAGLDVSNGDGLPQGSDSQRRDRFMTQLNQNQNSAVARATTDLLDHWVQQGGTLAFGAAEETSCFLLAPYDARSIWPFAIYPSGKCEVVFQHLKSREPFDDVETREQFRLRLNEASGVDLAEGKIGLRPGFNLRVLVDPSSLERVQAALDWFLQEVARELTLGHT